MLAIKLKPVGRKRQITYRVVVALKRSKLKGGYIEDLGWVNPQENKFHIDKERAQYWMEKGGAQPSDTAHNLMVKAKIIDDKKRPVHSKKKISEEELEKAEVAKAESEKEAEEDSVEGPESSNEEEGTDESGLEEAQTEEGEGEADSESEKQEGGGIQEEDEKQESSSAESPSHKASVDQGALEDKEEKE